MDRKLLLFSFVLLTLVAFSGQAWSTNIDLTYESPLLLGEWINGIPSTENNDVIVINELIGMTTDTTYTIEAGDIAGDQLVGDVLIRSSNSLTGVPGAILDGASKSESEDLGFDITEISASGYDWVVAKYDQDQAGSLIWYIGDLADTDTITILDAWTNDPDNYNPHAISNFVLIKGDGNGNVQIIPEPATFMLFGIGLLGLARVSRRKK